MYGTVATAPAASWTSWLNLNTLLLVAGVGLLVFLGYWFFGSNKQGFDANREHGQGSGGSKDDGAQQAVVHFFYATWCPHCKTAMPDWEAFKSEYNGTTVNGYTVFCEEHDCTDHEANAELSQMIQAFKVAGFPTVKLVKGDQVIECNARPTKANLAEFVQTVL